MLQGVVFDLDGTLLDTEKLYRRFWVEAARQMGYAQLELGVFADNLRAAALYESLGFQEWGRMRNAFRLKDGTMVSVDCARGVVQTLPQ